MGKGSEHREGTYRCPVCGHRDVARLRSDQEYRSVSCTHCDTRLIVWPRGADSVRLAVQVSGERATH